MELHKFLEARIAEDEAVARAAVELHGSGDWRVRDAFRFGAMVVIGEPYEDIADWDDEPTYGDNLHGDFYPAEADHIARFDPARVLAECAAKRAVVEMIPTVLPGRWSDGYEKGEYAAIFDVLRALAAPYSAHPDYDPSWAVA